MVVSRAAQSLICRHNLLDVKPYKYNFVDVESVIHHIKHHPTTRVPADTALCSERRIDVHVKNTCSIREYQERVVQALVANDVICPTLVVMPCGSGKTLTSLCCAAKAQQRTLIITNYKIVAQQWKKELLTNFETCPEKIQCIADANFTVDVNDPAWFTIITYDALTSFSSIEGRSLLLFLLTTDFTTIILDEAHKAVASSYFSIIVRLSGTFLAFTATPVREDAEIVCLRQLVCHEMEVDANELIAQNFISRVLCRTITVHTDERLRDTTLTQTQQVKAAVVNPNKTCLLINLLTEFVAENQRILVYCDDIWSLHHVYNELHKTFAAVLIGPIWMKSTTEEREDAVRQFLEHTGVLLISRTGDEGIDVPSATRLIQICTMWGSRRQHAQRIGRLQRPSDMVCEAITLVSANTREVEFASRRDEYLEEMQYTVKRESICDNVDYEYAHLLAAIKASQNKRKHP